MLVQKTTTIHLPTPARVHKLVCLSISTVLITTAKNIIVYDIIANTQLSNTDIEHWKIDGVNSEQDTLTILEAVFHPYTQKLLLLLSRKTTEKHQNWIFISTCLSQANTLLQPTTLMSYENTPTKYEKMQLQPRIIIFPRSHYFALIRQFYNESMIVVFQQDAHVDSFFANQENMAQFDEINTLVSFRALFDSRIHFELFDLRVDQKLKQKKDERKVSIKLQANVNKSGVVVAIKKIGNKQSKFLGNQEHGNSTEQNSEQKQRSLAVIGINWRNKSIQYIIYDYKSAEIVHIVSNTKQNTLLLSFLCMTSSHKICALQSTNGKISLVYENYSVSNEVSTKSDCQLYEVNDRLEEWDAYRVSQDDFVAVNYSQPLEDQSILECNLYRNMERKEALVRLALSQNMSEGLLQTMLDMYYQ